MWMSVQMWFAKWKTYFVLALVLATLASGFVVGYKTADALAQAARTAEVEAANRALLRTVETHNAASTLLEQKLASARKQTRTITKEVIVEVQKPVYRDCPVPVDGVRLLNRARRGEPTAQPDAALPAASSAP